MNKKVLVLFFSAVIFLHPSFALSECGKIYFLTGIYFEPTPFIGDVVPPDSRGLSLGLTQTIFHELVNSLKKDSDSLLVIGPNIISDSSLKSVISINLFFDTLSVIKNKLILLINFKERNIDVESNISRSGLIENKKNLFYKTYCSYLVISFIENPNENFNDQIAALKSILINNKDQRIILFLEKSFYDNEGVLKSGLSENDRLLLDFIMHNKAIKLVLSGNNIASRMFSVDNQYFLQAPNVSIYPCKFAEIALYENQIDINMRQVPLRSIVKILEKNIVNLNASDLNIKNKGLVKYLDNNFKKNKYTISF